ncbi:MAG TPA: ferrochelatase [Glaciihabitans sp.]|jgi:ferrochelatase|nr:ferrochelatase [Glaciihabitans sp.]
MTITNGLVQNASPAASSGPEHVEVPVAYDAILLTSFGGPEGQDDVIPFLRNVTGGRGIPEERLEEVAHHYRAFGGVSPINAQNRALKVAMEEELAARGINLPVIWGNRNWAPYTRDALVEANERGFTNLIAIGTSAYSSYSSCRQYREDYAKALADTGLGDVLVIDKVRQFFDHPGFVVPFIDGVSQGLKEATEAGFAPGDIHVLFATHSIPSTDAAKSGPAERGFGPGGAYEAQHLAVAEVVMSAALDTDDAPNTDTPIAWSLVYQSRSGPPSMPWLEPDINDAMRELAATGVKAFVIVPLGFVSDHMEVKWDLDTEALETAEELGAFAVRVPTPGIHPAYVTGLIDLVMERVNGTPAAERPAMTELGPWYDVCRSGCCENVRLGFKPALSGLAP